MQLFCSFPVLQVPVSVWEVDCGFTCAHTCVCVTMKHQSISKWLSQLGLPQYCMVLEQEYDGVEVKPKVTFLKLWINDINREQTNHIYCTRLQEEFPEAVLENLDEQSQQQKALCLPIKKAGT